MTASTILTAQHIREALDYDPSTGIFTRKVRTAQRHQVGDRADFAINSGGARGYYRVSLFSQRYLAHRLAWLYVHGRWPEHEIDHINGDPSDNRLSNLRDVPGTINAQNKRRARSDNATSDYLGVHIHPQSKRWRARIQHQGRFIHIGMFDTPEDAHAAYINTKRRIHEGCTV